MTVLRCPAAIRGSDSRVPPTTRFAPLLPSPCLGGDGGDKQPTHPFFLLLGTLFWGLWNSCPPGCAVAWPEQPRGAAAGRSWAVLTSCLRGIEPLLAQGATQSPSLETHQCRKPGQKKGAASTQKGKVICPSRRLERNLEQSFFACQSNPLTFSNNAATL